MAEAKTKTDEQAQEPEAPTYHVDRLVAEAEDFFGEPTHVVAGALSDETKKNFTRDEAKQAIRSWLKREVTTEA